MNDDDMMKAMNDTIAFFASAGVENARRRQRQAAYGRARAYRQRKRGAGAKHTATAPAWYECETNPDEGFLGEVKKIPLAKASEVLKADMMKAASTHTAQPPQGKRLAVKDTTPFWNDHHDGLDGIRHGALEVFEGLGYDKRAMNARARRHQRATI